MAKVKTSVFQWEGLSKKGQPLKGESTALNAATVKAQLRKQGITPKKVKKKASAMFSLGGDGGKKIQTSDITFFTRQMATMIKSGVPLVQAFDIVSEGLENKSMRKLVSTVRDDVSAGNDFASSLKKHPQQFDELFCNLVESGEQSGALEEMLDKVAIYKEKTEALKKKIKKALMYPAVTLMVSAVVTVILLVKVVPTFEAMFSSMGAELPVPTQVVVAMSEWLQANYLFIFGILVVTGVSFSQAVQRSPAFKDKVDGWTLKAPLFGGLIMKAAIARFARVLSTTFSAGVPLVDALESVAGAVGNAVYRDAVISVRDEVSQGQQMHLAMKATGVFPNMVTQMTSIGEESGSLDTMLDKVANYYEDEVDSAVDGLTAMIEPLVMTFLGVVIGGLIIAMYLPIFKMGDIV